MPNSIQRPARVLAVGAHPDDCELLSGGTLARFAEQSASILICALARGDKGTRDQARCDMAAIRASEAARAAGTLAAHYVNLDARDGEIQSTPELREKLLATIRSFNPDLILTHWAGDYHADHRATAELVADCSWFAASPGHAPDHPPVAAPIALFHMDTLAGLSFEPTEYVDITSVWEKKESMLRCHASQLGSDAQHGDRDLVALARDVARFRGHQCGVELAEGFRPSLQWKRVRPFRLLP